MKIIFIICVSLFNSILNIQIIDYDLTNVNNKRIGQLKNGNIYLLYIPAKKNQKIQISLTINNYYRKINRTPISYYYIYENTIKFNRNLNNGLFYPITSKINQNVYKINISHTVSIINSGYIIVKFSPIYDIPNMNIEIKRNENKPKDQPLYPSSKTYTLQNNKDQTFYNLTKDIKYYFILEASFLKTAKIKIDMSLSSYLTDNYITVQEIKNKDNFGSSNNGNGSIYKLNGIIRNDNLYKFNPVNYTVIYPSSKYLLLTFIPQYNVSNFYIKVGLSGIIYKLSKSSSSSNLNIYVNSDETYYFKVEFDDNYKSLNISFKDNNYINYLYYYELSNNNSPVKNYNSIRLINKRINYNKIISYILYNFTSNNKKDIIFKLEPSNFGYNKINYLYIQYDFLYKYYNLKFGYQGQTFNLVKGNEYNFKACSSSININIEIRLKYHYSYTLPFNYFKIKEYSSSGYYSYIRSSEISFIRTYKNGEFIYTCDHQLYSYYYSYLLIQILPNKDIPNFDIKLNYIYNSNNNNINNSNYSNNKRKNKIFIITMIVVPILIVIIIIIIICYKCKKNSHLNELNLDNLDQNNNVYSINDSLKNNEDEQSYNKHEDFQSYQEINDYSYNKNNSNDYMFPYDQPYGGRNRNDDQNLVNSTIN